MESLSSFWKSEGCHNLSAFPAGAYYIEPSAYASFMSWREIQCSSICELG